MPGPPQLGNCISKAEIASLLLLSPLHLGTDVEGQKSETQSFGRGMARERRYKRNKKGKVEK